MREPTAPTPAGRFDEEGDWLVRQFVPADGLQRPPEEYVARHAHSIGAFSFHLYRFADPALGTWVRRVGELLDSRELIELCRATFLTAEEAAAAGRSEEAG